MADSSEMYDEAVRLKDAGDLEAAVAKLREVLAADPDHLLSHSALGVYLQKLGQYDDAIKHAEKVVELCPDDSFAHTQLSVIYMKCGRIPEAEEAKANAHRVQMGGH